MTSFALKWIAAVTMLIDHATLTFVPYGTALYWVGRSVGRLAFPIFAFLLAEGFFYTRDARKYLLRLAVFAIISEIPFDLMVSRTAIDWHSQNVFVTLALSLLGLYLFDSFAASNDKAPALLTLLATGIAAQIFRADYGAFGVLMVFVFYFFRGSKIKISLGLAGAVLLLAFSHLLDANMRFTNSTLITLFELGALAPILLYARKRRKGYTKPWAKWFFYVFYPAHMLVLAALTKII
ncbi:conjugal transfer protein TraX [Clostridia bacterium]|nr:conjugal transfer protein TraX [Clostridia bacterium]